MKDYYKDAVSVITIANGVVQDNLLFTGENATERAEAKFVAIAKEKSLTELSADNIEFILDEGVFEFPDGSVCIGNPSAVINEDDDEASEIAMDRAAPQPGDPGYSV